VLENIRNKIIIFLLPTSKSVPLKRRLQTVLLIVYSFKFHPSQNDKISGKSRISLSYLNRSWREGFGAEISLTA